jgi:hypothetical protein
MKEPQTGRPRTKADLAAWALGLIEGMGEEVKLLAHSVPLELREQPGERERWSTKDELAHLAYWLEVFLDNLAALRDSQPLTDVRDYLTLNDQAWEERKGWTWAEACGALERGLDRLELGIHYFPSVAWTDVKRFSLERGRPLIRSLSYEVVDHPLHHLVGLYNKLGQSENAVAMLSRMLERVAQRGMSRWSAPTRRKVGKLLERLK